MTEPTPTAEWTWKRDEGGMVLLYENDQWRAIASRYLADGQAQAICDVLTGCNHVQSDEGTPTAREQAYYDQQAMGGYIDGLQSALDDMRERAEKAEAENKRLREMVEGRFDGYDQDGEPVLPRGWVPVDGGRLDELEAAEAELEGFAEVLSEVAKVYDDLTRGFVSKPTTRAADVVAQHDEHCRFKADRDAHQARYIELLEAALMTVGPLNDILALRAVINRHKETE